MSPRPPAPLVRRPARAAVAGWMLALALAAPLRAQEPTPEPTRAATPTAAPLPLGEVAVKSDELAVYLRQVEERTAADSPEQPISAALPDVARQVREQADVTRRLLAGSPSLREVDGHIEVWRALRTQLDGWRALLGTRIGELDAEIGGLARLRAIWRATRDEARAQGAPATVVERIAATLAAIATTRDLIDAQRQRLLVLQDGVVAQSAALREPLRALTDYRERGLDRLLVAEAPPLWEALRTVNVPAAAQSVLTGGHDELRALRRYLADRLPRLALLLACFAVLVALLFRARRLAEKWASEDATLARAARAFAVPVSSALLVTLVSTPWFFPDAPLLLKDAVGLLVLVPTLHLLRRLVDPPMAPALWALGLFYVVDRGCRVLAGQPGLEQSLFLLEMLAAAAFLGWLLRSGRFRALFSAESRWAASAEHAARLLIALLVIAGTAGALGFMQLARYLQEALIDSSFAAVVLFGMLQVLEGVWAYLLRTRIARRLRMIEVHRAILQRRGERVLGWLAFLAWLAVTLSKARVLRPAWAAVREALTATVAIGSLSLSLGAVLAFAVTVWLSFALSRFIRFALEEDVFPRLALERGMPYALSSLTHYAILFIGFLMALAATGIDLDRFTLLAGAFGVGIGFGLQNVVNNFVSGLILLFERPIKVGDVIQVAQVSGEVKRIGIRSSLLRTFDGADVIVPNGDLVSGTLTNWTLTDSRRRIDITIGVAYGTDPEEVLAMLRRIAGGHPFVLEQPAPVALFTGFGDNALTFQLFCWTDRFDRWGGTRSELAVAINKALAEAGIEIPFPQRDMRVTGGGTPLTVRIAKDGE